MRELIDKLSKNANLCDYELKHLIENISDEDLEYLNITARKNRSNLRQAGVCKRIDWVYKSLQK